MREIADMTTTGLIQTTKTAPGGQSATLTSSALAARESSVAQMRQLASWGQCLTRSRFLKVAGSTLFGALAHQVMKAQPALAHRAYPPICCGPSGQCNCCSGSSCCSSGCRRRYYECGGSAGGWYCCSGGSYSRIWFCADWWDSDGHRCICAGYKGWSC